VNDAEDTRLFFDLTFVPLVEKLRPAMKSLKNIVVMTDRAHMPASLPDALCYEELVEAEKDDFEWPQMDEDTACGLCYTSGTTGNPRARSSATARRCCTRMAWRYLTSWGCRRATACFRSCRCSTRSGWGIAYAAPLVGSKLVFPGAALDGQSLHELFESEKVTYSAGAWAASQPSSTCHHSELSLSH
jgi:fatty-acyl-CoA synthase